MEFPNGSRDVSAYQSYIRAAHKARSDEVRQLAGFAGRGLVVAARRLALPVVRLTRWLRRLQRQRAARRELEAMDDRLLNDLGINRAEIGKVVRNGKPASEPEAAPAHPHEAKRAAEVVELRREPDLMGALIVHGPWGRYSDHRTKRNDAA